MFPKKSAFGQHEDAMNQAAGIVRHPMAQTPEENQRLAALRPRTASIHIATLEQWVHSLELAENGGDIQDVLMDMRSYLPG